MYGCGGGGGRWGVCGYRILISHGGNYIPTK